MFQVDISCPYDVDTGSHTGLPTRLALWLPTQLSRRKSGNQANDAAFTVQYHRAAFAISNRFLRELILNRPDAYAGIRRSDPFRTFQQDDQGPSKTLLTNRPFQGWSATHEFSIARKPLRPWKGS